MTEKMNEFVTQTKLHDEHTNGNCLRACLATIFEVGIDSIPCFEDMRSEWHDAFYQWIHEQGREFESSELDPFDMYPWARPYIATGQSPRGEYRHSVVYQHGELLHDPYPGGTGLSETRIYVYWWFPRRRPTYD